MRVVPMQFRAARDYVAANHRHRLAPAGGLFAIGAAEGETIVGVVIIGRPVSRHLDDGVTVEVTRLCTDGSRNACSLLYAAARRAARALGYRRLITYTLKSESGASLRGAGLTLITETRGESWNRRGRPRLDRYTIENKLRWEAQL